MYTSVGEEVLLEFQDVRATRNIYASYADTDHADRQMKEVTAIVRSCSLIQRSTDSLDRSIAFLAQRKCDTADQENLRKTMDRLAKVRDTSRRILEETVAHSHG